MFQSVQLLGELSYLHLQLLVLLLQLQGPLLGQQDPPAGLVPALPHCDVVPLAPQAVLRAVLADASLGHRGPGQQEGREVLGGETGTRLSSGASVGRHVLHKRKHAGLTC